MHHGEKALGSLVDLTLSNLIGLDRDQGVVTSFGLHRNRDAADGSGELPAAVLLFHWSQRSAEKSSGTGEHFVGPKVRSMEVLHGIPLTVQYSYLSS
jgi:hypothetical protein